MTTVPPSSSDTKPKVWLSLGAAFLSALGAGVCCAAPLVYLLFGVSFAGLSRLSALEWLQWPLSAAAVVILLWLFWRLYFSNRPLCATGLHKYIRGIFWVTVLGVGALLTYPYVVLWWWS